MLPSRNRRRIQVGIRFASRYSTCHPRPASASTSRSNSRHPLSPSPASLSVVNLCSNHYFDSPRAFSSSTLFNSSSSATNVKPRIAESLGGGGGGGGGIGGNGSGINSSLGTESNSSGSNSSSYSWMNLTNPRLLKSHLDKFVIGQSRAKKILAVAAYNHYVRMRANDQRQEDERNRQLELENEMLKNVEKELQHQQKMREAAEASDKAKKLEREPRSSTSRNATPNRELRLGRLSSDAQVDEARSLAFGRREREWLLNDQDPQESKSTSTSTPTSPSQPQPRISSSTLKPQDVDELAEVAARAHEDVLSDYMSQAAGVKRRKDNSNSEEFSLHYFSSYPNRHEGSTSNRKNSASSPNSDSQTSSARSSIDTSLPQRALNSSTGLRSEHISWRAAKAAKDTEERARKALESVELKLSSDWGNRSSHTSRLKQLAKVDPEPASTSTKSSSSSNPTSPPSLLSDPSFKSPIPSSSESSETPLFSKSNVLIIGPSGSGKSLLLKTIATALHVPFVHLDCTPWTQAGYVGDDPTILGERLLSASGWNLEKAQRGIVCIDEVDKIARRPGDSSSKDVGGEGVQQALLSILEGTVLNVQDKNGAATAAATPTGGSGNGLESNSSTTRSWWKSMEEQNARKATSAGLPGMSSNGALGNQSGSFQLDTSSVLFILCGAFVGLEKVIAERLARESVSNGTFRTLEEASSKVTSNKDELFALCEPEDLVKYGLIPEFCGRIPVVASLSSLSEDDLFRVLTEPKNSLVSQYESLLKASDIDLKFTTKALRTIASLAAKKGTGARSLRSILEDRLLEVMYSSGSSVRYALLDEKAAKGESECKIWGRSGIHSFSSAWEDEENPLKTPDGMGVKVAGPGPSTTKSSAATSSMASQNLKYQSSTSPVGNHRATRDLIRRRSRARLTRPSRVGNMRIQVVENM